MLRIPSEEELEIDLTPLFGEKEYLTNQAVDNYLAQKGFIVLHPGSGFSIKVDADYKTNYPQMVEKIHEVECKIIYKRKGKMGVKKTNDEINVEDIPF